jgi:hypothetical protein
MLVYIIHPRVLAHRWTTVKSNVPYDVWFCLKRRSQTQLLASREPVSISISQFGSVNVPGQGIHLFNVTVSVCNGAIIPLLFVSEQCEPSFMLLLVMSIHLNHGLCAGFYSRVIGRRSTLHLEHESEAESLREVPQ